MWYLIWAIIVLPAMTYAALGRARAYEKDYDNKQKKGYGFSLDKFENKKLVSHMTAMEIQ